LEGGGLGIKDLEKFSRALRMRWLWYNWDQQERPWKHLLKVTDQSDRNLFFCSTRISVGNGKSTPFWKAKWLSGTSPKEMTLNLYKIARYKKKNVHTEMQGARWIKNIGAINSTTLMEEYILLFLALSTLRLSDQEDVIYWKWTTDGKYTVASAYEIQFHGSNGQFLATYIWQAMSKPKCKFFV
jgi:hypothetical protein